MVDLDKFICSLLNHSLGILDPFSRIHDALSEQGLEYKDGSIKPIEKEVKLKEGKWYVFTHASLFYDTINGEVVFKKDKPYRCLGEATLLGDGGDYCFRGQEDILKNLRPATDEEIKEIEKPSTIKFNEPDIDAMVKEFTKSKEERGVFGIELDAYRQGLEDMYRKIKGE